jgi:hypothetical protein
VYYLFSEAKYFWIGLFCWFGPWSLFLFANGWLKDSLYDSVILASQFLGSDRLHYPLPLLSLLSGLILAALVVIMGRRQLQLKYLFLILFFLAGLGVYFAIRVLGDSSTAINISSVIQRKLLAAVFFGALLLLAFESVKLIRTGGVARNPVSESSLRKIALYLISVSAATQAWPFFDQMHIWWSISPLLIIFSARVAVSIPKEFASRTNEIFVATAMIMVLLVASQFSTNKVELKSIGQKFVYVDELNEQTERLVQEFLRRNLPVGTEILNLCPNAYPFFRAGEYKSASRFFVYWSNFESALLDYRDYSPLEVRNVLVCETYLYQGEALNRYQKRQENILLEVPRLKLLEEISDGSFRWRLYSSEFKVDSE